MGRRNRGASALTPPREGSDISIVRRTVLEYENFQYPLLDRGP